MHPFVNFNRYAGAIFAFFGLTTLALDVAHSEEEEHYYRLTADRLACIISNHDAYVVGAGVIAYIHADNCPPGSASQTKPASDFTIIHAEVPKIEVRNGTKLDRVLTLSKSSMECLGGLTVPKSAKIVRFYPAMPCRIEVESKEP